MRELVVEADGGSRGNPGPAGYGAVVLDPATGETLAERAEFIGVATNNVAEYKGLVAGLRAALELFPDATVHVRMDSKLVVEQMSGRWKIKHPDMKPLAAEAARVFPAGRVRYEWIPRERNKHADRLANEAMDAGRRGEQWSPSATTAALAPTADLAAARAAAGDATAGAARARAALASTRPEPEPEGLFAPDETLAAQARASLSAAAEADREAATSGDFEAEAGHPAPTTPAPTAPASGWSGPDMGAPATFVLLRHGETALTPEKRFSGSGGSDPELSAAGVRQAEAVAAALAARGTIQEIVSSPLTRCRQTAQAVAARLGLDVRIEQGLRETDFGAWEGLTFAEVRERYKDDLDAWLASPKAAPTGGGESFATVARRVAVTRDRLAAAHAGRTVLLVTHVTPIKTLVRLALGAPPESLFRMELSAASLSAVAYYADGNASVRLLNDTSHLR
ncbi:bifunctional RNase H/acid phosphatase [Streptomyces sp. SKN60]|uniref:bifunctional RNase H/acid phosphatase n=1 Tax=Streptomyces sp. SKN60 TaxID=2855506 RepID=UPI00224805AF|nr:bifunctional RNase H/acid phosphatase [Streptomyces sp. SKN60]MCX2179550.1 bifunctional RNase H/acid phosphatase [Streptomyces sp. SKN60]